MNPKILINKSLFSLAILFSLSFSAFSQESVSKRNSPFSPNPKKRRENLTAIIKQEDPTKNVGSENGKPSESDLNIVSDSNPAKTDEAKPEPEINTAETTAAENTPQTVRETNTAESKENVADEFDEVQVNEKILDAAEKSGKLNSNPTEVYRIGAGDILLISLQNAPAKETNYFTVLQDGSIDYPLAGVPVKVAGMTVEETEEILRSKIKLYENPAVAVKIREYNSHSYTVLGLVEKPGEKYLRREAVPLLVVRAESVADVKAERITIKRKNGETVALTSKDEGYENTLIYSGDIVEFAGAEKILVVSKSSEYYYIAGEITAGGQKDFVEGITLTQAVIASGGLKRPGVRKALIRRKNEKGLLVTSEYNLKSINDGKSPDPVLQSGDTVEIGN